MRRAIRILCILIIMIASALVATVSRADAATLTSMTPTAGPVGALVTFKGTGFTGPAQVSFNGTAASSVHVLSATKITAPVPAGASTGPVTVTTGGSTLAAGTFTVVASLAFTPVSTGPPTTATNLLGTGFQPGEAVDIYVGTSDIALVVTSGSGTFTYPFTVPRTATPGALWATAIGRRSGYAAQAAFTVHTDWPRVGGNNSNRNNNPYENVLTPSNVAQLEERWGGLFPATSSPVVVGNRVLFGSNNTFKAVDVNGGGMLWSTPTTSVAQGEPTVRGGVVYFATANGTVYALDVATGAQRWTASTGAYTFDAPLISGNSVYIGTTVLQTQANKMFAFNLSNGAQQWQVPVDGAVWGSPSVYRDTVLVGTDRGMLYSLVAATGATRWSKTMPLQAGIEGSPLVANGLAYVATYGSSALAFTAAEGRLQWSSGGNRTLEGGLALDGSTLVADDDDGELVGYDATSGAEKWSNAGMPSGTEGTPMTANGVAYVVDAYGGVFAYRTSDGARLWRSAGSLRSMANGSACVVDGRLYANAGTLTAWDLDATPPAMARPQPTSLHPNLALRAVPSG